jgi:hypothetical protein
MTTSKTDIKKLYGLARNECSFPKCNMKLVDFETKINTGHMCHMKGKEPDSARYDETQTNEERDAYENLILMCPLHHSVIDSDPISYTVQRLHEIKDQHEKSAPPINELDDELIEIIENFVEADFVIQSFKQEGGQIAYQITNITTGGPELEPDLDVYFIDENGNPSDDLLVQPVYYIELEKPVKRSKMFSGLDVSKILTSGFIPKTPDPDLVSINIGIENKGTTSAENIHIFLEFPEDCSLITKADATRDHISFIRTNINGLYVGKKENIAAGRLNELGNDLSYEEYDPIYVRFPEKEEMVSILASIIQKGKPPIEKKLKVFVKPMYLERKNL